jgi:hypothetical protein
MITLNQIIKQFREIATNHKQINTFGFGDLPEIGKEKDIVYPLMWVLQKSSSIDNNDLRLKYQFFFSDLVHKDLSNNDEVLSDQLLTALDVIAQLQHSAYDWEYTQGAQLEPFTGKWSDEVSGWIMDCEVVVPSPYNRCAIPFDPAPLPIESSGFVTIFDTDGNIIDYVSNNGNYILKQYQELSILSGDVNGSNNIFVFNGDVRRVYFNGQLQKKNTDYSLTGSTITLTRTPIDATGGELADWVSADGYK